MCTMPLSTGSLKTCNQDLLICAKLEMVQICHLLKVGYLLIHSENLFRNGEFFMFGSVASLPGNQNDAKT